MLTNVAIIVSLVTWFTGLEERKENKLFSTWTIINDGKDDKSGVVRTAVERLHRDGFSLSGLELNETNLSKANLFKANLFKANLFKANLSKANLSKANLFEVYLSEADLRRAKLSEANFSGANLSRVDLIWANLSEAKLIRTNLSEADLRGVDLRGADLSKADLRGANLIGTNLRGADLFNAKNLSNAQIKLACNWKEAAYVNSTIVKDNVDRTTIEYKWIPRDKQANQEKIKEIEQDKDSDPENPPDCSRWNKD